MNDNIPTLTTVTDAQALLRELGETCDWVSVFWDKGWGDDDITAEAAIIVDGDGQNPKALLSGAVYAALVDSGAVAEDSYAGFKARRLHDFKTPPAPERAGPTSNEVAEQAIRDVIARHEDLPIRASFYRGISKGNSWNPINEEIMQTSAVRGGWFVLLKPGHSDVALSAWEPDILGGGIIGGLGDGAQVSMLAYPKSGGAVNLDALAGPAFRDELLAAIREKAAVVESTRAGVR